MRVKRGEYGAAPECNGGGNWRSPRKLADQWHRPARFPHDEDLEAALPNIEPSSPWWVASRLTTTPSKPSRGGGGEPGSIPGGVAPGFSHVGILPDDVYVALSFRRYSTLTSLQPHRLSRLGCTEAELRNCGNPPVTCEGALVQERERHLFAQRRVVRVGTRLAGNYNST
ncbi:hypothetical protein PR048_014606 [Dryococelus australis]|uniref:Uncharacterized protein n=1 Tax=Dryococelus australis TaxID=614101 RepID=A0ABQ9HEP5_9NEOP|nr:hypothetical protein PR048_014606 [Dryococelus australis]